MNWLWLAAHVGALFTFLALSLAVPAQTFVPFWSAALWFASGLGAIALATLVFIPPTITWQLIRSTGYSWAYALAGGAAAWRLVPFSWTFWNTSQGRILTGITFDFVHVLLRAILPGVVADRAHLVIGTPGFRVIIGDACSGFEGLGMMLVFGLLWLWFFRREIRFPQALLLVPVGLLLMWTLNAVRIVLLIAIGHAGAPQIALGAFHSQAGWIAFSGVTLAYAGALQHFHWFAKDSSPTTATVNPTAVFLLPFLLILAVSLLTHAGSADFEWLYPLRFVAACGALWLWRSRYAALDWSLSWTGPVIGMAVFVIWIALERIMHPSAIVTTPVALAGASATTRIVWISFRVLAATTTVPIAEELAFRGFLLRRIMADDFEATSMGRFTWTAVLVSSLAFGMLHGSRWFAGTLAGVLYAGAVARKGKLGDAVVAHATTNAILAAYVLLYDQWQLW